ncbi:hypothetical protein L0222_11060 [bacterium]|nr:hypothetical protein [bacterium]MCI0601566.1 hypothetical protein [bacterium]
MDTTTHLKMKFLSIVFFCIFSSCALADDEFPKLQFGGLIDVRFAKTDEARSWLDGGLGKTRFGSLGEEGSELLRLSQGSLLLTAAASDDLSARLHVNIDAEPNRDRNRSRIDLIEGFISYRPVFSPQIRFRFRGGVFFPPVSLENREAAWTSPFSITSSAINSWIGEEVRVTAAEANFILSHNSSEYSLGGAVLGNNDPAGTLLAWRGWALHDRQTGFSDRLPLAQIPALQPDGLFPEQPDFVEPFREVDGRLGFYGTVGIRNKHFELNGIYYDNRGQQTKFDGVQYAWETDFINVGIDVPIGEHLEFISQYMSGDSRMGFGDMVHIDFDAFYVLATATIDRYRLTARYDDFRVHDKDAFQAIDDNRENGNAWTFAWMVHFAEKHRLAVELLRVESDRPVRGSINLPIRQIEWQLQTSFRLRF